MSAWRGKIVLVYVAPGAPSSGPGIALESPEMVERNGRQFLSGTVPQHEGDWASGLVAEVAWDQVMHLLVFDSLEHYQQRIGSAPAFWQLSSDPNDPPS